MVVSEAMSLYVESYYRAQEIVHAAQFTCSNNSRVIDERLNDIAGGSLYNTAADKAALVPVKVAYPNMFFRGFVAHGLHLLVKNIFAPTKAKHGLAFADYPPGTPFEHLLVFAEKAPNAVL
jgi:hypothetical protein